MTDQLQSLLDRIQQDGVEKARAEADGIIENARDRAAKIVSDAEAKASEIRAAAEHDSRLSTERGRKALEQASRDVLLSLGDAIDRTIRGLVKQDTGAALDTDAFAAVVAEIAAAYASSGETARDITVLVPEDKRETILQHVQARLGKAAADGLEISGDSRVTRGFRVVLKGENVEHDFSEEAVTETLCRLLRPHIAGIVQEAAASD